MSRRVYISRMFKFEAAHSLPEHKGSCKNVHGHSYTGEVTISCLEEDMQNGMVMDYGDLKIIIKEVITGKYDHINLNVIFSNPTAENMVKVIFDHVDNRINLPVKLVKVSLKETVNSNCYFM